MPKDGCPEIGPLVDACLDQSDEGPPAFIQEFHKCLKHDGEYILWWSGAFRRKGSSGSWSSICTHFGDPSGAPDGPDSTVDRLPAAHIERMLSPLAHEARIGIMQQLYAEGRASSELTELTGMKGGNLHYHLKELIYAGYVQQREGKYSLTQLGAQILITVASIASQNVRDQGEEGLQVIGGWDRDDEDAD